MGRVLPTLLVLALASVAYAQPDITWTKTEDLGGGIYGYEFTVNANDGKMLSMFANVTFEGVQGGTIVQKDPMDNPAFAVNNETDADNWEGIGGYTKPLDSWFGDPFALSPPAQISALDVASNYYHIEAGTGGGSEYASAKLAYIALGGGSEVHVSGVVSREGVNYDVDFVTPEPATLLLLAGGAAALVLRRKR
jgi:hypothetical protein